MAKNGQQASRKETFAQGDGGYPKNGFGGAKDHGAKGDRLLFLHG